MVDLMGLNNLTHIKEHLDITNNARLENLKALTKLTYVGGILSIQKNPKLTSLSGLNNVDFNGISLLRISDNQTLSNCAVQRICSYLKSNVNNDKNFIYSNSGECNNIIELRKACN